MATKARQQYFADEDSLQKIRREFSIADDIQQKIDSIEPGAQVNKIETVKVNGTALVPDANKAVNVEVPEVIDNLYTVDPDNALSAKQGKLLYDYIQNIASRGRFLSNWNSATGLPMTNPSESPYPYKSGDYFVVSNVATSGGTNYRPDGSSYIIGQASTVVETEDVSVSDFYFYDGTNWLLLSNSGRQIAVDSSLSTTSTNPVENRVITNALNNKQDVLTAGNHIDITNNVISAEGFQEELTAGDNITIEDVCATESDMQGPAPSGFHVPLTTEWQGLKAIMDGLSLTIGNDWRINLHLPFAGCRSFSSARDSFQGSGGRYWSSTPRDSDMAYILSFGSTNILPQNVYERAYGCSVRCFKNSFTVPTSSWTVINGTLGGAGIFRNQTEGLISITSDGTTGYTIQDKNLGATTVYNDGDILSEANCGKYYQRGNNYGFPRTGSVTTSSTQVDASNYGPGNYYNSDTFIIGSGDWSNVQNDNLWGGVSQGTHQECIHNVISATDTTYTAGTGISIDANNVISSTATSAQWGNITGTLSNQTDLQSALDSKVNLGINKVFDNTVVEIGKWEHEPGGDSSGHHIELDPSGEVSTYNLTTAGHNEATLGSGTLELLNNTVLDGNKTATFDHEKIVADDGTDTETYNFFGNNRIARLSDVGTGYTAGNGIDIDANNEISIDTSVVATQTDLNSKQDTLTAGTGINIDANDVITNTLPGPTIAATTPTGTEGALWYDTTNDVLMAHDGTAWKEAGTQMKVLSYGHSTWQDFLDAYNENAVVYCRASSNSDPSTGSQTRMAFMAYVNNASNPTEVEFQYYRSRSDHNTAANQLDQVFVYKLTSASGGTWTVTERNTGAKAVAGTGINLAFGSGNMTISADTTVLATKTDLSSKQDTLVSGTNIKSINNNSLLGSGNLTLNDVKVSSTTPSSPTEGMVWYDTTNDQLKVYDGTNWNVTGKEYTAGEGIVIGTVHSDMQGPAPDGFHIPSEDEWEALCGILTSTFSMASNDTTMGTYLKMPMAGYRYYNADVRDVGAGGQYWTASNSSTYPYAYDLYFSSGMLSLGHILRVCLANSIRCFKDAPVIPNSSWTTLYDGSSIASGAGVFYNATDGLISVSGDGTTWYTIMDKNLGATTVYNQGDTLTDANCGYFYQWGNNYGFPHSGTVTTSSTKIDASSYGPGNYYSSSTFITVSANPYDWSSVQNDNLWGGVTQGTWVGGDGNTIINTGVLSVNGQTGDVTIPTGLQESPNSTITGIKYIRHGTEADYANLSQYYTDTPGDTEFHCF